MNGATTAPPTRILLVEDNPGDARLILEMLGGPRSRRFELERAERLESALACLRRSKTDLVLLDLGLPDSQGLATFERIRRQKQTGPVVVISGLDDEEMALAAVRAGAQDYLVKGEIQAPLLVRVIRHAIGRHALEEQLRKAQRLEAIGQLVAGVAHDFNNLLTAILGHAEIHLQDLPDHDPAHSGLSEIKSAAERGAVLIRQLLAFSRQQVLEPRVLDLSELICGLEGLLRRVLGEKVALRTCLTPGLGTVLADPGQLEQVIVNLAVNARDAMPGGGTLTLATENVDLDGLYTQSHAQVQAGRYVLLTITDSGTGMDAATIARAFEPFFTTKPRHKGTGLGLATVHGIVHQSGGHVWVYSEPGRGTAFKVYLPRVDLPAEPATAKQPSAQTLRGTESVLVVEDDDAVRVLTCRALESFGYRVLAADGSEEAMELARRHPEPIPLVISDVVMPGLDGRELAKRLVELRPETRVIFVSGYSEEAVAHQGILAPGVHFLQKPFSLEGLARKVRVVLDEPPPPRDG